MEAAACTGRSNWINISRRVRDESTPDVGQRLEDLLLLSEHILTSDWLLARPQTMTSVSNVQQSSTNHPEVWLHVKTSQRTGGATRDPHHGLTIQTLKPSWKTFIYTCTVFILDCSFNSKTNISYKTFFILRSCSVYRKTHCTSFIYMYFLQNEAVFYIRDC